MKTSVWILCPCWILVGLMISQSLASEGGIGMDPYSSSLNAVPRMGRRSPNPFQRNSPFGKGNFRFFRPRRFLSPFSALGFRYQDGPAFNDPISTRQKKDGTTKEVKRSPAPSPHPLPFARPATTVTAGQKTWDSLISDSTRQAILQKMAEAALKSEPLSSPENTVKLTSGPDYGASASSPLARFLSNYWPGSRV